jgi:hypothetical protein
METKMTTRNRVPPLDVTPQESIAIILKEIEEQEQAWNDLITSLSPDQFTKPVDNSWSALDVFIHTISWIENALRIAHLQTNAEEPDPGPNKGPAGYLHINVDKFNAEVIESHCGMTMNEALEWNHRVNNDLRNALRKLPTDRVLSGAGRYCDSMWYWMPAFIHTRGHRRKVEKLLEEIEQQRFS